ncbi:2291_t:CDS:2 [Entrophospora sp. SA101]|nr:2291_t:CDS:2 [Entrophospora sp. SA101]
MEDILNNVVVSNTNNSTTIATSDTPSPTTSQQPTASDLLVINNSNSPPSSGGGGSAKECRRKKKAYVADLEEKATHLEEENVKLHNKLEFKSMLSVIIKWLSLTPSKFITSSSQLSSR